MCNMGLMDRVIRVVVGLILLAAAFFTVHWWVGIFGVIILGTSVFSFCLLYKVLGIDTGCQKNRGE
ncbi:DUF2892 domain-containing protein [Campylobacterota bacterium]